VHEFLYLSSSKLNQFMRVAPYSLPVKAAFAEISLPLLGAKLGVDGGSSGGRADMRKLAWVMKSLGYSRRGLWPYDHPGVRDGDWVDFELPLHYSVLTAGQLRLLVFGQRTSEVEEARMLLYGSPRNLITAPPTDDAAIDLDSSPDSFARLVRALGSDDFNSVTDDRRAWIRRGSIGLLRHLENNAVGAPCFSGWAQVVTVVAGLDKKDKSVEGLASGLGLGERIIIASPLFICFCDSIDN
jgi:hypothetical protein